MVKLIVGGKGSGKSRRLVDDLNKQAENTENNIICILRGDRLDKYVKFRVRMIDINQYPINNYDELLAFIAGLNARDYDITHIYIDSIAKAHSMPMMRSSAASPTCSRALTPRRTTRTSGARCWKPTRSAASAAKGRVPRSHPRHR